MYKVNTRKVLPEIRGLFLLFLVTLMAFHGVLARATNGLECNPNQVKMSCIMGCFSCFDTYGVDIYNMAACCRDCRLTDADIIDEGPSKCSTQYIRSSWLKRLG
ncbi:hypothetical protein BgiMline_008688 [Biomphalaria glabrata]